MPSRTKRDARPTVRATRSKARFATDLLCQLLELEGRSGQEQQVVAFIVEQLRNAGLPSSAILVDQAHRSSVHGGETGNLIVKLPGTRRAARRLLAAHMDTVPLCHGARPLRKGGRIVARDRTTGLGGDDRSGCAVLLTTALELLNEGLDHPPLTFLWTVQEETGLHGARHVALSELGRPRMACNWDGASAHRITLGATGGYRMDIRVAGIASHAGGRPEEGVSAIAIASLAISALVRGGWHGLIERDGHRGTSNVGVIRGGDATNVVTDCVEVRAEARSHDAKFRQRIVREIESAFRRAAKEVKNVAGKTGKVDIVGRLDYESFLLQRDHPSAVEAATAVEAAGLVPEFTISNGGLDANWLTARGIPTATLGCGQNAIHTVDEWLDLEEFARACCVARQFASPKSVAAAGSHSGR